MSIKHVINGKIFDFGGSSVSGQDIIDVIAPPTSSLPKNVVVGRDIVPTSTFKDMTVPPREPIVIMDNDVIQASGTSALTLKEGQLIERDIATFFKVYHPGVEPEGFLKDDYIVIKNFPLPVRYHALKIPVFWPFEGFPELAPAGIFVPTDHVATPQLAKVFSAFEDKPPQYPRVEGLREFGWTWLCNGIKGREFEGNWRYAYTTKNGRDTLAGLLAHFQAEIYRGVV